MTVRLQPRWSSLAVFPIYLAIVTYFILLFAEPEGIVGEYPFGFASSLGLGLFALLWLLAGRRHGIRVDEDGLMDIHSRTYLAFAEISRIDVQIHELEYAGKTHKVRAVELSGSGGTISFGDLGPLGLRHADIANIPGAEYLLALVADRTNSNALFPSAWRNPGSNEKQTEPASPETGGSSPEPAPEEPAASPSGKRSVVGPIALGVKLGPKFLGIAFKLLKTVKPGAALITFAAYSFVFSWEFALGFLLVIGVHECGHVFAMWRSGVRVKGIYFIPFFGGVAVSEDEARTAKENAYIALNGPAWGTFLALGMWFLHVGLDSRWPVLASLASWGAFINLLNLLPVMPLDGGRLLTALTMSRRWSGPLIVVSLLLGFVLAYLGEVELLALMVFIGLWESAQQFRQASLARMLRGLSPARKLSFDSVEHFGGMVGWIAAGRRAKRAIDQRRAVHARVQNLRHHQPMTASQALTMMIEYVALVAALLWLMWRSSGLEGGGNAWSFLF